MDVPTVIAQSIVIVFVFLVGIWVGKGDGLDIERLETVLWRIPQDDDPERYAKTLAREYAKLGRGGVPR